MDWNFLIKNKNSINVSTDTRNLPQGCVFFALKGERFNGNQYAVQALEQGAAYAVVDEDIPQTCSQQKCYAGKLIRVENSLLALQDLAREWRRQMGIPVIGITGTNGKTTTKELMAAVLKTKYNLLYTEGNLNNHIGVPLTLLRLTSEHRLAIVEMGASHPGDIKELVDIALPDYGLITNVGKAHLQGFGSFEGVMKTKRELYDYLLEHQGVIFRNQDNVLLAEMLRQSGVEHANGLPLREVNYSTSPMLQGTHLVGDYNSENIRAALCVGEYFGVDRETAEKAIRDYVPSNNRSQLLTTDKNTLVVDAYNANVTSMTAAIQAFDGDTLILGDMLELGEYSKAEHEHILELALSKKSMVETAEKTVSQKSQGGDIKSQAACIRPVKTVQNILLVGEEFKCVGSANSMLELARSQGINILTFTNVDELRKHLQHDPLQGRKILIKGSHGIHLEKIIDLL